MAERRTSKYVLVIGVAATVMVAGVAILFSRLDLADSAAWATIGALFIGILTLAVGVLQMMGHGWRSDTKGTRSSGLAAQSEASVRPPNAKQPPAMRDQFNIGSVGTFNVNNRDS
ncbi:hypothetical protein ACGFIY_04830 [Micromonospora chersina]|uniref:hypothetical protein n=1 Tax=Micromonospora chersina TaxID=47854 RepID=UPI00371D15A8